MLSICIFGSQARRTADELSDRDVVLVGAPSPKFDRAIRDWSERDWNVSVFERMAIERMADVKALFVQHLKQEGCLLHDDEGFMASVFTRYTPKTDYLAERNDALMQIAALPEPQGSYWHDLCLADIMYVLFRNAAILHMASLGEYCFEYETLVGRIADVVGLGWQFYEALLPLRRLKHSYRRRKDGLVFRSEFDDAFRAIRAMICRIPTSSISGISAGITTDEYFKLRLSELDIVKSDIPSQLDVLGPESEFFALWQKIKCGGGYPKPRLTLQ